MEMFLFRHAEYERLYNCTFYDIDEIPLENRRHGFLGVSIILISAFYEILYIPCIISISKHLQNAAYKFMFYIGITDIVCMFFNGFVTGYFAIQGVVYCSYPKFIYLTGAIALALWAAETSAAMLLAINRCLEMWSPKVAYTLFKGYRTWLWICLPVAYMLTFYIFTKPLLFSGIYLSWFFNPHVGYVDDFGLVYNNMLHSIHNAVVFAGLSGIYLLFSILLMIKSSNFQTYTAHRSFSQRMSFFQVLLISIVNATAAAVYVFMQFARINDAFILVGTFTWLSAHGMPSVIYLTMNRTIRNDCRNMLLGIIGQQRSVATATLTDSQQGAKRSDGASDAPMDDMLL